ncbi:uncharacterized protein LOC127773498 [Oryza glaberrima]|uniref:uncharacterized protein LOC127773498 n=1 Tax=Oryza glaberrima TaxID=4538 RepID=UPI00224C2D7F|nr:uncharacterized protein LOC127773498 [Oryza glaberrima]
MTPMTCCSGSSPRSTRRGGGVLGRDDTGGPRRGDEVNEAGGVGGWERDVKKSSPPPPPRTAPTRRASPAAPWAMRRRRSPAVAEPSRLGPAAVAFCSIIKNVIEHPHDIKYRRLRKFQRSVASYKAAMEFLELFGFCEDVVSDEIGRAETYLVLKRNDPGLPWLAKSSLEVSTIVSPSN